MCSHLLKPLKRIIARISNYIYHIVQGEIVIQSQTSTVAHWDDVGGWNRSLWKTAKVNQQLWQWSSSLLWRHNGHDGVSNHQLHDCLLNHSFRRRSKKTQKLRLTGLCAGNSPVTVEFPAQMASNTEHVSIWWRHHAIGIFRFHQQKGYKDRGS